MDIPAVVPLLTAGAAVTAAVVGGLNYWEQRRKAWAERAAERRKGITAQLTEFYGPLHYYLSVTKALYQPLWAGKPDGFRTLTYLLDPAQMYRVDGQPRTVTLSKSDHALLKRIIRTQGKVEELIRTRGGLVENPALLSNYVPARPART